MPMPTKKEVLYDAVGPANATHNTGALNTSDFDAVLIEEAPVGGAAAAGQIYMRDMGNATQSVVGFVPTSADTNPNLAGWGTGVGAAAGAGYYKGGIAAPLPPSISIETGALGVGIATRIRVIGSRNFRGADGAKDIPTS